jgi:hypothetical protein
VNCCNQLHKGPVNSIVNYKTRLIGHANSGHVTFFAIYLTTFSVADCIALNAWMIVNNRIEYDVKGSGRGPIYSIISKFVWMYCRK